MGVVPFGDRIPPVRNELCDVVIAFIVPFFDESAFVMLEDNCDSVCRELSVVERNIRESERFRVDLDGLLQVLKVSNSGFGLSEERSTAVMKIQEAIMWLGMDLERLNDGVSCHEHGYDPSNAKVDPPPSGVKL